MIYFSRERPTDDDMHNITADALLRGLAESGRLPRRPMAVRRLDCRSEFGRQVAVDFEADADLDKSGGRRREGRVSFILIHRYSPLYFVNLDRRRIRYLRRAPK